ncbi:flagellar biosynthesis protein FlhB [uncultured Methylobacterium sp.]|jgi:flagellar biosynthetic protein FlhB|uniref:flagellar biosynthesis protein FlhB n=1 Tax=uncultured Methylobacterium sp. TaxID=157278 RepID=UPI00262625DB|nr:flagellar biosynthesis protein FlhB [uncultured Methylobacterium sp.]
MAEDTDQDSKTEEPTGRRISEAIEKGNIPFSREAPVFASFLALLVVLSYFVREHGATLARDLAPLFDHPRGFTLADGHDAMTLMLAVAAICARFLLPVLVVLCAFGLASTLLQNLPTVSSERIRPQWSRISPATGWGRLFGLSGAVEFLKSLFKFSAITVVSLMLLRSEQHKVVNAMYVDPSQLPELILSMAIRLVSAVSVATIVLVAGDLIWARLRWQRSLRMTRQEVKDEHKQTEGDPTVKSRIKSMILDRGRQRMLAAVPRATVVIANPTHYAIALRYERDENPAPLVLAKGKDLIALRIREIAEQHGIPVIEDKPLARSLHDSAEVDKMIPAEFYRAVAQILFFLFARSR